MRTAAILAALLLAVCLAGAFWFSDTRGAEPTSTEPTPPARAEVAQAPRDARALVSPEREVDPTRAAEEAALPVLEEMESATARARTRLTGRVIDERGRPLAGALVRAEYERHGMGFVHHGEGELARATTGADGRFTLSFDHAVVELAVEAEGYAILRETATVRPGQERDLGDLALDPGVVLSGRVFDRAGAPVAGVVVNSPRPRTPGLFIVGVDSGDRVAETDAEGRFSVPHQRVGPWQLNFHSEAHPAATLEGATERAGERVERLEIVLEDGVEIEGRVSGVPASEPGPLVVRARPQARRRAGSAIELELDFDPSGATDRSAPVDSDGRFLLRGLSAGQEYELVLRRDSKDFFQRKTRSAPLTVAAGQRGVRLEYDAGATLVFRAVDARTKRPIEELSVAAGIAWRITGEGGETGRRYPDGLVRYEGLRFAGDDATASLEVEAVGYERIEKAGIALTRGAELDLGVLELVPVPVVRVTVTDRASGAPVPGASVTLRQEQGRGQGNALSFTRDLSSAGEHVSFGGGETRRATTGEDGRCVLTSFPGETCTLDVRPREHAPDRSSGLELPAKGDFELDVEVGVGGTVRVAVVDGAGEPVTRARVEHRPTTDGPRPMRFGGTRGTRVGADGTSVFERLAPGVHGFRIDEANEPGGGGGFVVAFDGPGTGGGGSGKGWTEILVEDGGSHELELVAPGRGALRGTVTEDGARLAGATVMLVEDDMDGSMHFFGPGGPSATTDSGGRYALEDLKPGAYTLRVTHPARVMPDEQDVTILEGDNTADVALAVSILEGVVKDEAGEPLAGAVVRVSREGAQQDFHRVAISMVVDDSSEAQVISGSPGGPRPVRTDERGQYTLRGVTPGVELFVEARAEGYPTTTADPVTLAPGEVRRGVDVRLSKGGTVVITTRGGEESGMGPLVRLEYVGDDVEEGEVDPQMTVVQSGRAEQRDLRPGPWKVSLETMGALETEPVGEPRTVEVRAGETVTAEFDVP